MADNIKGIVIRIGADTTALSSALKGINSESKASEAELRKLNKLLKVDPKNLTLVIQKQKVLGNEIKTTKDKLATLKTAAKQAREQLEKGEISAAQYRDLQREIVQTEQKLKSLRKESLLSTDKLKNVASGIGGGLKAVGKVAATAVGAVASAGAAASVALGGVALAAASSADEILTLSAQTGLSTKELQKYQYAAELIDVPLETITGSMAKLTRNMATASKGSGDAAKAFSALGVKITDGSGKLRSNQAVFTDAIKALGNIENETQRDAYAMQIFGKSAQDLNPLIKGGADALQKYGDQAEAAGYTQRCRPRWMPGSPT